MSEGGHSPEEQTPENLPRTPTEASKRFLENCRNKLMASGIWAFSTGVGTTLGIMELPTNKYAAMTFGIGAGLMAVGAVNEGMKAYRNAKQLTEGQAK